MINKEIIFKIFSDLGLSSDDVVMIHGDAGPAAQISYKNGPDKLTEFIEIITSYFVNGTVLVPSFTYSLTKNESYDPLHTQSNVGLFSEAFRRCHGVSRTLHPIFSFSIYGKNKQKFTDANINDCFGVGTVFDEFFKIDGKILCIGCSLDRVTFIHYVEQQLGVPYRYFKNFHGEIIVNNISQKVTTQYFVRDLNVDATAELSLLRNSALKSGDLVQSSIGRFPVSCISSHNFFNAAQKLYALDPFSFVKQRLINA